MGKRIGIGLLKLLLQCIILFAAACIAALTEWVHPALSAICLWAVYPLTGAAAAYFVTVRGINNYIAWIPAMAMLPIGFYCVWGYLPPMGMVLVTALLGIIGAATGDTKKRFEGRKRR